jgi:hypothetical protein
MKPNNRERVSDGGQGLFAGGPALECALIKDMGDDAGYWYGRPRAVAPYCS